MLLPSAHPLQELACGVVERFLRFQEEGSTQHQLVGVALLPEFLHNNDVVLETRLPATTVNHVGWLARIPVQESENSTEVRCKQSHQRCT